MGDNSKTCLRPALISNPPGLICITPKGQFLKCVHEKNKLFFLCNELFRNGFTEHPTIWGSLKNGNRIYLPNPPPQKKEKKKIIELGNIFIFMLILPPSYIIIYYILLKHLYHTYL